MFKSQQPFLGYTWSSMRAESSLKQPKSSQTWVSPNNWHTSSHLDISQYVQFKIACLICCFFWFMAYGVIGCNSWSVCWISRYVMAHGGNITHRQFLVPHSKCLVTASVSTFRVTGRSCLGRTKGSQKQEHQIKIQLVFLGKFGCTNNWQAFIAI